MKQRKTGTVNATAYVKGTEYDALVEYRICPAEPDVNFYGGLEIEGVWCEDLGDLLDEMTEAECDSLVDSITDEVNQRCADDIDEYGDYLYEQAKDRRLGL